MKELMEKNLIDGNDILHLVEQNIQDVTANNVDQLNIDSNKIEAIKQANGWSHPKEVKADYEFITGDDGQITGVTIKYQGKVIGSAEYTLIKMEKSKFDWVDFYGHTKCMVNGNTYTTLFEVKVGNHVRFQDYKFNSGELEAKVATLIQNVAKRLKEKM